jgi:hypothetical protein
MKSLSQTFKEALSEDGYAAAPADGIGPTIYPDVATSPADMYNPDYVKGSGDIPQQKRKKPAEAKPADTNI